MSESIFVLAQSSTTAAALELWIKIAGSTYQRSIDVVRHVYRRHHHDLGADEYSEIEGKIRLFLKRDDSRRHEIPTILVDRIDADDLSAIKDGESWENTIAMLILSFPEVRWLFALMRSRAEFPVLDHSLLKLFEDVPRNPIFDATGLRSWVLQRTNINMGSGSPMLPVRSKSHLAAAIEDEIGYALYNAYTAYRFGCPADAIVSWRSMNNRFGMKKEHGCWLLMEDMSLNFPDKKNDVKLALLSQRQKYCVGLASGDGSIEKSTYRILITGQTRPDSGLLSENRDYLRRKAVGRGRIIMKPARGMFDLWKRIGLLKPGLDERNTGRVEGFKRPQSAYPSSDETPHGAPGKLMMVAGRLMQRAQALKEGQLSVPRAILGAVLANDALELTCGQTPTTALEALSLKHFFEVKIECLFLGVEYNINIKDRFREIRIDIRRILRWVYRQAKDRVEVNALLSIASMITRLFRENGQFDEEQACLKLQRALNRRWFYKQRPWLKGLQPFHAYIEGLVGSLPRFVASLLTWPTAFGLFTTYWWGINLLPEGNALLLSRLSIADNLFASYVTFFGLQPAGNDLQGWAQAVTVVLILLGFLHLGVFISHLYTLLSRR